MYSIIEQGGLQFKVTPGATITVPLITAEKGSEISIPKVLLPVDGDAVKVGTPCVKNASVTAKVIDHVKGDKILIVKKHRRKDYQRVNGHRQKYTKLEIVSINTGK
jgi:large subunit ribosomal protein L21